MADALTSTDGFTRMQANVSHNSVVPRTRLSRMSCLTAAVQRRLATLSPARCTTASTPSKRAASIVPPVGSQRISFAPAPLERRTTRRTECPSASSAGRSAFPTRPVEPVTATIIDLPHKLATGGRGTMSASPFLIFATSFFHELALGACEAVLAFLVDLSQDLVLASFIGIGLL